jgi:hypothetical protein
MFEHLTQSELDRYHKPCVPCDGRAPQAASTAEFDVRSQLQRNVNAAGLPQILGLQLMQPRS